MNTHSSIYVFFPLCSLLAGALALSEDKITPVNTAKLQAAAGAEHEVRLTNSLRRGKSGSDDHFTAQKRPDRSDDEEDSGATFFDYEENVHRVFDEVFLNGRADTSDDVEKGPKKAEEEECTIEENEVLRTSEPLCRLHLSGADVALQARGKSVDGIYKAFSCFNGLPIYRREGSSDSTVLWYSKVFDDWQISEVAGKPDDSASQTSHVIVYGGNWSTASRPNHLPRGAWHVIPKRDDSEQAHESLDLIITCVDEALTAKPTEAAQKYQPKRQHLAQYNSYWSAEYSINSQHNGLCRFWPQFSGCSQANARLWREVDNILKPIVDRWNQLQVVEA